MSSRETVLVIGATGFLGASLVPYLRQGGRRVIESSRRTGSGEQSVLHPCDAIRVGELIDEHQVTCIVNLAAATNVDRCESDVGMAFEANANLPRTISRGILRSKSKPFFVHLSTDQVYGGTGEHQEQTVNPVNVYGLTKLAGELLVDTDDVAILRTNFFGRSRSNIRASFSDWVVRALRLNERITLFDDVVFSGLHVNTLCEIIDRFISMRVSGTFNVGSRGSVSKAGFALALAEHLDLPTRFATIGKVSERQLAARRPLNMSMCVDAVERTLDIECPDIHQEIRRTAEEYLNDERR